MSLSFFLCLRGLSESFSSILWPPLSAFPLQFCSHPVWLWSWPAQGEEKAMADGWCPCCCPEEEGVLVCCWDGFPPAGTQETPLGCSGGLWQSSAAPLCGENHKIFWACNFKGPDLLRAECEAQREVITSLLWEKRFGNKHPYKSWGGLHYGMSPLCLLMSCEEFLKQEGELFSDTSLHGNGKVRN